MRRFISMLAHEIASARLRRAPILLLVLCMVMRPALAAVEPVTVPTPPPPADSDAAGNDSDPTKPVVFSPRYEYFNLRNDVSIGNLILRSDRPFSRILPDGRKLPVAILRFDLTFVTAQLPGETTTGRGDFYAQTIFLPYLSRKFALAIGPAISIPTATQDVLGTGKWTAAPLIAPIWFFARKMGFVFVKVQDYSSFAGDESRPDIHAVTVTPTILRRLGHGWWMVGDSESRTDFKTDLTSFKSGLLVGHMFNRGFGGWIKPEFPWGEHRQGDWILKAGVVWVEK